MLLCCIDYDKIHSFSLVNLLLRKGHDKRSPEHVWSGLALDPLNGERDERAH